MGQTVCQKLNKEMLANSLIISEPLIKKKLIHISQFHWLDGYGEEGEQHMLVHVLNLY